MNKSEDIHELLSDLYDIHSRMTHYEQKKFKNILHNIGLLTQQGNHETEEERIDKLVQIANYVSRKLKEADPHQRANDARSLVELRNRFAHSSVSIDPAEEKKYYTLLWRVLSNSASKWDPGQLSNLLAYCLPDVEINFDPYLVGPTRVIAFYKAAFNTLDEQRKHEAFKELVLRLVSDKRLRELLEVTRTRK